MGTIGLHIDIFVILCHVRSSKGKTVGTATLSPQNPSPPAPTDEEQEAKAKEPGAKTWVGRLGRVRAWILGIGAVAGALTTVAALIFVLFPGIQPTGPSLEGSATLGIARVEHGVTFGEYLQRPWVPKEGAVQNDEQLKLDGNVVYFDVETRGFSRKSAHVRYTVYDADTQEPVSGLAFRRAWPSDTIIPSSQTSKAQLETWVPVPQDGSGGPYAVWIELYTTIGEQETRLASDEETMGGQ